VAGVLTIRREQLAVLSKAMRRPSEDEVAAHLRKHFPAPCDALGPDGLAAFVAYAFDRAASHGLTALRDVSKYADLAMALGRDFDVDPALPWVRAILDSPDFTDPEIRFGFLCREAVRRTTPEEE
jgi:hypothetical protein